MKKAKKRLICLFLSVLISLFMGGCAGEEWLEQIPKDFSVEGKAQEEEIANAESTAETLAEDAELASLEGLAEAEVESGQPIEMPIESETEQDEEVSAEAFVESQLSEVAPLYYYNTLSDVEKLWYMNMKEALFSQKEVRLSDKGLSAGMDEADIDKVFHCVMNDYPELFYVDGYQYVRHTRDDVITAYDFSGSYTVQGEEKEQKAAKIEQEANLLLEGISSEASDYDKVKYVYETLIQNTDYVSESPDNQNIYSVFVNGSSVCSGYAKATQYLLNRMGVECTLVQGTVDSGAHAWNLVKIDDEYYYVDTTWGDASYFASGQEVENLNHFISYDYLCVTTEQMSRTHTFDEDVPLPECTATEANYYVRENMVFSSFDKERIAQMINEAKAAGEEGVTIKCTDTNCLEEIKRILLDEQVIFELLEDIWGPVAYTCNEEQLSLTIWLD